MEEAGAGNVGHRGSHLLPGVNHVHAEGVYCVAPGREKSRQSLALWEDGPIWKTSAVLTSCKEPSQAGGVDG